MDSERCSVSLSLSLCFLSDPLYVSPRFTPVLQRAAKGRSGHCVHARPHAPLSWLLPLPSTSIYGPSHSHGLMQ